MKPSGRTRIPAPPRRYDTHSILEVRDEGPVEPPVRSAAPSRRAQRVGGGIEATDLVPQVGTKRAKVLGERVEQAARAFQDERYVEARRILRSVVREAPGSSESQELLGLTYYRLGEWADALKHLENFVALNPGSTEQHPVMADCHRALHHWEQVDRLWLELAEVSPSPDLVNEGRIVRAGALADQGRVSDAIRELERGWRLPARPKDRHFRRAYALLGLYDRAGDGIRRRKLQAWLDQFEG